MDPISIQSAAGSNWARRAASPDADLAAILRQGRLVAGDVLETLGGGFVMVGIGRHRVPARSDSNLSPGQRYLFEVVGSQPLEIRALTQAGQGDESLLKALRNVLGADQPLGALLESLSAELKRARRASDRSSAALEALEKAIEAQVLAPGEGARALAAKLRAGGQSYEARWARLAFDSLGEGEVERFGRELARAILADALGPSAGNLDDRAAHAGVMLRRMFAQAAPNCELGETVARWAGGEEFPELPQGLRALLERVLAPEVEPGRETALAQRLAAMDLGALPRAMREAALRALLGLAAAGAPAGRSAIASGAAALALDLKALLLRASGELEPGSLRSTLERALASVEAEQLINVARHASQQSSHWSLPVACGEHWTTAHVFVRPDSERARGEPGSSDAPRRFAVAVEFSRTGPVQVDFLLRCGELSARVLATSSGVVEFLRERLPDLEEHLALGGRRVRATVSEPGPARTASADGVQDLRYLSDHNVVDLTG